MSYPGAKWRKQHGQEQPAQPFQPAQHPPGPPPPYTASAPAPPMATAHVVPNDGAAAMYAPVVNVALASAPPAPSAPDLPPASAPPAPPMAGPIPANMYAPVGAAAAAPRPPPPGYAQAQAQAQAPPGGRPQLPQGMNYYSQGNLQGAIPFSSPCNGKKRALFVGITYRGTRAQLNGCVNDVKNLYQFVTRTYGFRREDIRILTDDPSFTDAPPTKHNILESMRWLVWQVQPGDSLLFHYSGHGGSVRDRNGDEVDNYDETILPVDHERVGEILDDEIHELLVKPLPQGVRLHAIFDSCHSGSVMDLPFTYALDGSEEIVQVDNTQQAIGSIANAGLAYLMGNKNLALGMALEGVGSLLFGNKTNEEARRRTEQRNQSAADIIQIGGCRDDQTSADAKINGQASGALSWAFIQALSQDPNQQYAQLLKHMRQLMRGRYTQIPQISASHRIDLFTRVHM